MKHPSPTIFIPIVLIAVLAYGGWIVDRERAAGRSTMSGFFENQEAQPASEAGGRVTAVLVREGDTVKADQVIVTLDTSANTDTVAARRAAVDQARANLALVDAGPRAEDILKQRAAVSVDAAALAKLVVGNRPEDIAQARDRLRSADAAYAKAVNGSRPEEIAQARAVAANSDAKLAAAVRGDTVDQIAQFKDRLDQANASALDAAQDFDRYSRLYRQDAVTRQQYDQAKANRDAASAAAQEAKDAYDNAVAGTPKEELAAAKADAVRTHAAFTLAVAGSRPEDIAAAKADRDLALAAYRLAVAGSRWEDIAGARAKLAESEQALATLVHGSRPDEKREARAAYDAAVASLAEAQVAVNESVIRAGKPGVIEQVLVTPGDVVAIGTPVARLDAPDDIWVRVYVPESDLAKVSPGAQASLKVDGIVAPVPAVVESVATQGEFTPANLQTPDERGKQVFAVRLRLAKPNSRIKAGMYATVRSLGGIRL